MDASMEMFWREVAEKGVSALAQDLPDAASIALIERFGAHNYHPLPVNIVRGEGAHVWDGAGNVCIDCVGAYSALAHGHLAEAIVRTARAQLERLTLTSRAYYCSEMALFLQALCSYADLDMACPMNTGAEAVETCIKLARKWAYAKKGVPREKAEILVCEGNFHGRTTTIVGFSTEAAYRDGFGPFTPGFRVIPYGDADALDAAIDENTAAFLVEPIQAEAGVIVPPNGFLARARQICSDRSVLLVWDEVQTGFCRTGERFAWMHEDAKPDLMAVGKALGGGILPVSAAVGTREIMEVFRPGDHGSTFGGNPLASAVGVAAMAEMEVHGYAARSVRLGDRLRSAFASSLGDAARDIRGRGLLIGLEVQDHIDTQRLSQSFLNHGILTKETRQRTFRFAPPISSEEPLMDEIAARAARAVTDATT